jgi:hypothetical protein
MEELRREEIIYDLVILYSMCRSVPYSVEPFDDLRLILLHVRRSILRLSHATLTSQASFSHLVSPLRFTRSLSFSHASLRQSLHASLLTRTSKSFHMLALDVLA